MTAHNTPTDLTQCTAEQLLHLYRSGQASPVDATKALLARIETVTHHQYAGRVKAAEGSRVHHLRQQHL